MKNFLIVLSGLALLLLGIFSKYFYDILKEKCWLPNSPSLIWIVVVAARCISLIVIVDLPALLKKE